MLTLFHICHSICRKSFITALDIEINSGYGKWLIPPAFNLSYPHTCRLTQTKSDKKISWLANIIFFLATKHFLWKNKFSLIIPYRFAVHWKTTGNYEKTYCTKTLSIKTTKEMKFKPDKSLWEREGGSAPLLPHEPNIKVILVKTLHWFIGERRESAVLWIFKFLEWEDERKKKSTEVFSNPYPLPILKLDLYDFSKNYL